MAIGPNGVGLVLPLALAVAFAGVVAPVAAASCVLSEPQRGTVAQIIDGETLALTDGTIVRLIGAKAPSPPLGWRGDDPWPMVAEAKQALERLAAGAEIELRYGGRRVDRHGYALAQGFVAKGDARIWLQQALVAQGLARVYSFPDNRACVAELLESEAAARAARKGLWGVSAYRIRDAGGDPEAIARLKHSYQLVEGQVAAVGEGGNRIYLNFGTDWHTDFTVEIERKDARAFVAAGLDPHALAGKSVRVRVRVRGWVEWRNGPMIQASHPEQIELLPSSSGPKPPEPEPKPGSVAL